FPQLSVALAANVTTASQLPGAVNTSCAAGQVIVGFSRSCTVTVKLQRFVLPPPSVATQFTVVTPEVNALPDDGVQTTVVPVQLSVALTANVTTASQCPSDVFVTMFAGQVTNGA